MKLLPGLGGVAARMPKVMEQRPSPYRGFVQPQVQSQSRWATLIALQSWSRVVKMVLQFKVDGGG